MLRSIQSSKMTVTNLIIGFVIVYLIGLHGASAEDIPCYFPNGNLAPNDRVCITEGDRSGMCCQDGYTCMNNYLCKPPAERRGSHGWATPYVRGSCIDKYWRNDQCPLIMCTNGDYDNLGGSMGVAKCRNDTDGGFQCTNKRNVQEIDCDESRLPFYPENSECRWRSCARSSDQVLTRNRPGNSIDHDRNCLLGGTQSYRHCFE